MIGEYPDGEIKLKMSVHHNYELERVMLGFGDSITVLKPRSLEQSIKRQIRRAYKNYGMDNK